MKKPLIQLVVGLCLCFVAMLGVDLGSGNGDFYSVQLVSEAGAQEQVYEACPGGDVSFVHPVTRTTVCGHGGVNGIVPHFDEYHYTECVDADSCCPISGFDDPISCP
ncbi:hypothetical protein SAMN04488104_101680 [Algoriphagus faecimaris]|uniref:Uncharacterized protein n=1 Tax=Algoriphagus faecimaris TaxID=686796 RepID=A0A1G6SFJ7_9BACT|nr:hypothetical protein [Algoriphagus faecimaris]SDD14946.1 hypothetical protein SAMN04488104_101680 [Algoriphagus faecimaris]